MTIEEIIAILKNRLAFNAQQRTAAVNRGDIDQVAALDADTVTTQASLDEMQAMV